MLLDALAQDLLVVRAVHQGLAVKVVPLSGEGKDVCDNLTFKGKSQLQMYVYCIRCKRLKYLKINTKEHKTF